MNQKTKRMTWSFRYHWQAEMMRFIWEQYLWDHPFLNLLESYLILVQSISQLQVLFAMIEPQEILNSRSTILWAVPSYKEISYRKDAEQRLMICTNPIPIKFWVRHHQSLHMDQQNFKVLFGKTILVFSHLVQKELV